MPRPRRRRRVVADAAAVLLLLGGCAQVLGLPADDEVALIADAFCRCADFDGAWPGEDCREHIEGRLSAASEEERRAWLDVFAERSCRDCTNVEGRAACAGGPPVCVNTGGACGSTAACCLADGENVYCGAQGVCVREPDGCLQPNQPCTPDVDVCCGEVGQLTSCASPLGGSPRCIERCTAGEAGNCADCCTRATFTRGMERATLSLCLNPENDCTKFCNADDPAPTCPADQVCIPQRALFTATEDRAWIDTCVPRCDPEAPSCTDGCCARITNDAGEVGFGCVTVVTATECSQRFCYEPHGSPCDCGGPACTCEPQALFNGEPLGFSASRCVPVPGG